MLAGLENYIENKGRDILIVLQIKMGNHGPSLL